MTIMELIISVQSAIALNILYYRLCDNKINVHSNLQWLQTHLRHYGIVTKEAD